MRWAGSVTALGAALRFIPDYRLGEEGYGYLVPYLKDRKKKPGKKIELPPNSQARNELSRQEGFAVCEQQRASPLALP